ncbi:transmembrane protein TMEM144 [Chloropicon roscoffensis]|uniref:Transmembrane protein TMEM144 n=1 Tax=Chloropicon roscoffensis TaxID=1461544 RepID=A0AAX4PMH5_9CHLO
MVSTEATGLAWALASVFLFGSFAVPIKTPAMQQARVHPIVIQCYKSTACFVTSFLVLLLRDFKFSYWGVLGAGIWVLNGIAAIAAVQCAGIGVSQAIWSAVTIVVSFVWGTCYYRENIPRLNLAILGVVLMTGGVSSVGVVSSGQTLRSLLKPQDGADRRDRGLVSYTKLEEGKGSDVEEDEAGRGKGSGAGGALGAMSPRARGVLLAIYVGVANGSFMVPFKSAIQSSGLDAVEYVLSFGIGSAGITALVLALWLLLGEHRKPLGPSWRIALKPSLLTGLLWSGGNFCSIYATQLLDLTVAWPLVQCQLLVSTAWGIFYYHEVQGRQRIAMVVGSSLVVVVGVLFLSLSKAS